MPGVKVILGGSLVTSWMRINAWKNQFKGIIDHVISGPGEHPLLSILGLSTQKHQHYYPSFHKFPLNEYLTPGPILPYSSSRGCYWSKCSFCPENAEGSAYSQIPRETAAKELYALSSEFCPTLIHLVDNAISPAVMEGFAPTRLVFPGMALHDSPNILHIMTSVMSSSIQDV